MNNEQEDKASVLRSLLVSPYVVQCHNAVLRCTSVDEKRDIKKKKKRQYCYCVSDSLTMISWQKKKSSVGQGVCWPRMGLLVVTVHIMDLRIFTVVHYSRKIYHN